MPKKKKRGDKPGSARPDRRDSDPGSHLPDAWRVPQSHREESIDEELLSLEELRQLLPPQLSQISNEDLRDLLDYFANHQELATELTPARKTTTRWIRSTMKTGTRTTTTRFRRVNTARNRPFEFSAGYTDAIHELKEIGQIEDTNECRRRLVRLTEQCPLCGDVWFALATLEPANEPAKEYLLKAIESSDWMLDQAAANPKLERVLHHGYISLGLDAANELWKRGMRIDALDIHDRLLR